MSDPRPSGGVLLYQREDGAPALDVRLDAETVWLSQQQFAELFQTTRENITMHLRNVYLEGELDREATRKDFLQVRVEGSRSVRRAVAHHNLDAILSVGYRVKSAKRALAAKSYTRPSRRRQPTCSISSSRTTHCPMATNALRPPFSSPSSPETVS